MTKIENPLISLHQREPPLHFGPSNFNLTCIHNNMVQCGDKHYASSPSKLELEEAMMAMVEIPF
jgi:hypothetical protein